MKTLLVSDDDVVVVEIARRLRLGNSALYERFLKVASRFLIAAELVSPDRHRKRPVIDLTESSLDGHAN